MSTPGARSCSIFSLVGRLASVLRQTPSKVSSSGPVTPSTPRAAPTPSRSACSASTHARRARRSSSCASRFRASSSPAFLLKKSSHRMDNRSTKCVRLFTSWRSPSVASSAGSGSASYVSASIPHSSSSSALSRSSRSTSSSARRFARPLLIALSPACAKSTASMACGHD